MVNTPQDSSEIIPEELTAEAVVLETTNFKNIPISDPSRMDYLESELSNVKTELQNVKKDMNAKSIDGNLILFVLISAIILFSAYVLYKNRKSVKSKMKLLVDYYRKPITQ